MAAVISTGPRLPPLRENRAPRLGTLPWTPAGRRSLGIDSQIAILRSHANLMKSVHN